MFTYSRRIHFYETDLMGIVHHSNHLKFFEEARVSWFNQKHISHLDIWSDAVLGVVQSHVEYLKPIKFNDEIEISLQAQLKGPKVTFQYKILKDEKVCAQGWTDHVLMNSNLKMCKPSKELITIMEKEPWIETWL